MPELTTGKGQHKLKSCAQAVGLRHPPLVRARGAVDVGCKLLGRMTKVYVLPFGWRPVLPHLLRNNGQHDTELAYTPNLHSDRYGATTDPNQISKLAASAFWRNQGAQGFNDKATTAVVMQGAANASPHINRSCSSPMC